MNGTKRSNLKPGTHVRIVLKGDQRTGKLTEGIVKDILTKSAKHTRGIKVRLESGDISMSWNRVDLAALLHSCADRFSLLAGERDVTLYTDMPDETQIVGDGDRLLQVFTNLIDNAIKYTSAGGKVTLSLKEMADTVTISIADTGIGIPEADLSRIFERFYRVDKSRSRDAGGQSTSTGLGLAIAAEIVRAHGGRIEVESILDIGTRFTVTLPIRPSGSETRQDQAGGPT